MIQAGLQTPAREPYTPAEAVFRVSCSSRVLMRVCPRTFGGWQPFALAGFLLVGAGGSSVALGSCGDYLAHAQPRPHQPARIAERGELSPRDSAPLPQRGGEEGPTCNGSCRQAPPSPAPSRPNVEPVPDHWGLSADRTGPTTASRARVIPRPHAVVAVICREAPLRPPRPAC
jgi:hypothetical protein